VQIKRMRMRFVGLLLLCSIFPSNVHSDEPGAAGEREVIRLPVRVHRFQSDKERMLNCSLTDAEIREQFEAVNETWAQAKISWEIESIVDTVAQAPDAFAEAIKNPRGRLAAALVGNFSRENLLKDGFNVVVGEDYGRSIGGVFIPTADGVVFYAKHGPKGLQTPAVLAHELGHALGLPHTIFEKDNNLMMGSGASRVPTRVKPITDSQIQIARHYAKTGKPFKPPRVPPPSRSNEELLAILDPNGNGSFTASEAKEEHRLFATEFLRKASRAPSDALTRDEFLFIVQQQERQRAAQRAAQQRQAQGGAPRAGAGRGYGPEIVPQIFSRFDKDGDDKLTREEASNPRSLVNEYFDKWDTDDDGVLTREEVSTSLRKELAVLGALRGQD